MFLLALLALDGEAESSMEYMLAPSTSAEGPSQHEEQTFRYLHKLISVIVTLMSYYELLQYSGGLES